MAFVSNKYNFCFIHIYKTGGTTIRKLLIENVDDFTKVGHEHGDINECMELMPKIKGLYKFAYVRNPYDWLLSLYNYIRMPINHPDYEIVINLTFNEFLNWIKEVGTKRPNHIIAPRYMTQSEFIYNNNNNILVDEVYKYEDLSDVNKQSNVRVLFKKLNLIVPKKIPVLMKSDRNDYCIDNISKDDISLINDIFSDDFKNFNYKKINK